jgi:hypothetical protein
MSPRSSSSGLDLLDRSNFGARGHRAGLRSVRAMPCLTGRTDASHVGRSASRLSGLPGGMPSCPLRSSGQGVRRVVSEGSRGVPSDFPADRPHRSGCHFHRLRRPLARSFDRQRSTVGFSGVSSKQPNFCRSPLPAGGRNRFYDFVPVANPTFDGCLLAVGPPASGVTDSHDVTGGVYKAREHIHRGVMTRGY